jgi:ABC-type glycerol-3-phosphate transport system substrate-binding protein
LTLYFVTFSYSQTDSYLDGIINDFNKYSKSIGDDIYIHKILLCAANTTSFVNDYASTVEDMLRKDSAKYDFYMINTIYTERFGKYITDLKPYVSEETIKNYSNGVTSKIGYYKGKLVALPMYVDVGILYSNKNYLDKYNEKVPTTWDELIETAERIKDKEKKIGNFEIEGYLPNMPEEESSICSAIEFLYSFRDSPESDMPLYTSDNALRAFKKLIEIKKRICNEENFLMPDSSFFVTMFQNKTIFSRFFNIPLEDSFYLSKLPGEKEGLSASCVGGRTLIVDNKISEERKKAVGKAIDFFLSKDIQIKYAIQSGKHSGCDDIYYDKKLCEAINCEVFRNMQYVTRPTSLLSNYDLYSLKFRTIFRNFLKGSITAEEALKQIDYIASIYSIKYSSGLGYSIIGLTIALIVIIMGTYFIIINENFKFFINVMNKSYWIFTLLGLCVLLSYNFFVLDKITPFKCNAKLVCLLLGSSLFLYPVLIIELANFPSSNKYSESVKKNGLLYYICFVFIDVIFCGLILLLSPYKVKKEMINEGMNYNICVVNNNMHYIYLTIIILLKIILGFSVVLLTFIEWNRVSIFRDIRTITSSFYIDILLIGLLVIIRIINIKNLYFYVLMRVFIITMSILANYVTIIWIRMYSEFRGKNNEERNLIKQSKSIESESKSSSSFSSNEKKTIKQKIISYHYSTGSSIDGGSRISGTSVLSKTITSNVV